MDVNRDAESETSKREAKDELRHAYMELDRLHQKLQKERTSRGEMEAELDALRRSHESHVDTSALEIERKNDELQAAKDERNRMKEWLDRGVKECKRVAEESVKAKEELQAAEDNCVKLANEKTALTSQLRRLADELTAVKNDIENIESENEQLKEKLDSMKGHVTESEATRDEAKEAAKKLEGECMRLADRVDRLDECEQCLVDMCNNIADLIDDIELLEGNIANNRVDGALPSLHKRIIQGGGSRASTSAVGSASRFQKHLKGNASRAGSRQRERSPMSNGYGDTQHDDRIFTERHGTVERTQSGLSSASGQQQSSANANRSPRRQVSDQTMEYERGMHGGPSISDARELLHSLHFNVGKLNDTAFRFIRDRQRSHVEVQRMQQDELAAIQRDREQLLKRFDMEREELRERARQLEIQVTEMAQRMDIYTERAFNKLGDNSRGASPALPGLGTPMDNQSFGGFDIRRSPSPTVGRGGAATVADEGLDLNSMEVPELSKAEREVLFMRLNAAYKEYNELQQDIQHLQAENQRWRSKAAHRKIDWVKVNESHRRYQQLIKQMEMMKDYQERLREENEHLQEIADMHQLRAEETPEEAAARRADEKRQLKVNRLAFEQWKSEHLNGY